MESTQNKYPIFEANQVLSYTHLNQVFDYLNEQERLTRANLIGIGIACGSEIRLDQATWTIHHSRGCGVTSEGYLIVAPKDLALVSYREYRLPKELDYQPLVNKSLASPAQYPLWEMFPAGEPETTPLSTPAGFLNDKAMLLFLELKKEGLRNCSPSDCNDKGTQVTATVRRLLIKTDDLKTVLAEANTLAANLTFTDLEAALLARLNLPDLHLPRYDVPNSGLAASSAVLAAFLEVFQAGELAAHTANALTAAYNAFKPVVQERYPTNPFASFSARFGFLDKAPESTQHVRFLQYYYDFFDDLLKAYDEFRWKGAELLCSCCPPEGLFPRHLMLGVLFPASVATPGVYRQQFMASAAVSGCEEQTRELKQLFRRLVEMIARFTDTPPLAKASGSADIDETIRITPSRLGDVPLSNKAIPYYYQQTGSPPLFKLWNAEKTRRNRAVQNLSYRSDEYTPSAPEFVTHALRYDLEAHNFLRIEGHLGKDVQSVTKTLLSLKEQYRLPIEVVALRTGVFDEKLPIDLSKERCWFQDLEALYDALREELLCCLCGGVRFFYDLSIKDSKLPGGTPQHPLLKKYAPNYRFKAGTVGAWYENVLEIFQSKPYHDIDQDNIALREKQLNQFYSFLRSMGLVPADFTPVVSTYYLTKLADVLTESLGSMDFSDFENKYKDMIELVHSFRSDEIKKIPGDLDQFIPQEDLIDHLDQLLFSCKLDPIRAIHEEYVRRVRVIKQNQFLGFFLQKHPGIQHKAGTPLGGTFFLVYHKGDSQPSSGGSEAEKFIAEVVEKLDDGTVIADFFLPYLCCSDCPPIHYVLPVPPLGLTVNLGCTAPNGSAEATLTPQGGMPPISYQLDNQPFEELTGNLLLTAGAHTLVIRDSAGAESALQSISVPGPMAVGTEAYSDDVPAQSYQVGFEISGGTPPYQAEPGTITGTTTFLSKPIKSGETVKVTITDSKGCHVSKEFTHTVATGCDLPCDGLAIKCGYRFWLPEPDLEQKKLYAGYEAEMLKFELEFPQGGTVDLGSEVTNIIQAPPEALNQDFIQVVTEWLKHINQLIADKTGSEDWLRLEYRKSPKDPIGTLWIEHFACLSFEFHLKIMLFFENQEEPVEMEIIYAPEGTLIPNLEAELPAYNCTQVNKCDPEQPPIELCKGVKLKANILTADIAFESVSLDVASTGNDEPVAYFWEVQDGIPAWATGKKADIRFKRQSGAPTTKTVWLTVYTKKGCRFITTDKIELPGG